MRSETKRAEKDNAHSDDVASDRPGLSPRVGVQRLMLVADDDDGLRETLVEILELETDCALVAARDGTEALDTLLHRHVDVAILDHRMPGLTGAEVVEQARASGVPTAVILITAAPDVEAIATRLGLEYYLSKPFGVGQLLEMVERALSAPSDRSLHIPSDQ